jgi:hypothetical protein
MEYILDTSNRDYARRVLHNSMDFHLRLLLPVIGPGQRGTVGEGSEMLIRLEGSTKSPLP